MTLLRLALNLGVLLAILSLLVDAHNPWEISLKTREPHRRFDTKRLPASAGPFPDSRIHQIDLKRDPIPLGGGIGTLGTYYCEITVAGQNFRVVVVRYFPSHLFSSIRVYRPTNFVTMFKTGYWKLYPLCSNHKLHIGTRNTRSDLNLYVRLTPSTALVSASSS
jgi:hypothetical protein